MSTAAIMMVRDEEDILAEVLRNLCNHVDEIFVIDNGSKDRTREILDAFQRNVNLHWEPDNEVGYWQSKKMTALAQKALEAGHSWVVPVDADEMWYVCADPNQPISKFLASHGPDVAIVKAALYNHVPTTHDPEFVDKTASAFERLPWRMVEPGRLPKVACRLAGDLVIEAGNHSVKYLQNARYMTVGGLCIRHFSWRSEDQYVRKIRNGAEAYAATDLPEGVGAHWRMWEDADEEAIREHYRRWFLFEDPQQNKDLIRDQAPTMPWP